MIGGSSVCGKSGRWCWLICGGCIGLLLIPGRVV